MVVLPGPVVRSALTLATLRPVAANKSGPSTMFALPVFVPVPVAVVVFVPQAKGIM
jgi:hypothetical protein